tara:strand:- start:1221 stop:1571 length:351 start_codon:yes stop_codon:yes gene_type:complete
MENKIDLSKVVYLMIMLFVFTISVAFSQVKVIHFNAEWNKSNNVEWFNKLSDVKKENMDVGKGDCAKKYKIAVVPTIIVFDDGEEVARFQADLSFKLLATRKEVQEYINELLMSKF